MYRSFVTFYLFLILDLEEEEEPAKQVNVTFARHVPDFIQKMREQSFQTHTKKILEEAAIPCQYRKATSAELEVCSNL